MSTKSIRLDEDELIELTGWSQSSKQLEELRDRGFWRARLSRKGGVILERAHYEAVCAGAVEPSRSRGDNSGPRVHPIPGRTT